MLTFFFFFFTLSFLLSLLGLGHRGDAPRYAAGLDHPAAAVTGHAPVPTPPASDKELPPPPPPPPPLCGVLLIISVTKHT